MAFSPEHRDVSPHLKTGQYLEWITKLPSKDHPRESPVFFLKSNEWNFRITSYSSFAGKKKVEKYNTYIMIQNKRTDLESCRVKFQVGLKNEEFLSLHKGEFELSENLNFWSFSKKELVSKLEVTPQDCKMNDGIKFVFYFDNIYGALLKANEEPGGITVQTPIYMDTNILLKDVSKDLSRLFDEGTDYDIEFICGDEIFKAHKNVLCCRSDVFASMLRSDAMESETGQVNIQDVEGSIFRQFLKYCYTGVFPELTVDVALQFYETAIKYAVGPLKIQCTSFLTDNLSHDNACEILIVADRHNDLDFKKNVLEYVIKEEIQFMKEKWTELCKQNPKLANEVVSLFCQNVGSK